MTVSSFRSTPIPALIAIACLTAPVGVASAAEPAGESGAAAAQALFDEGKRLLAAGNPGAACPKLEESLELDYGMGAQFKLADCYQQTGRVASAWTAFLEVAAEAKRGGDAAREQVARERAAAIEPTLSRLRIVVTSPIEGLRVSRGNIEVGAAQWGMGVPTDAGDYAVRAEAPGMLPFERTVTVPHAAAVSLTIPELDPAPAVPLAPPSGPTPHRPDEGIEAWHWIAYSLIGVGAVNLAMGGVAGGISWANAGEADDHCNEDLCDAEGVTLREDAISAGDFSTLAFAIGAVAAAGGAALWIGLASTEQDSDSPAVGLSPTSVTLRGRF